MLITQHCLQPHSSKLVDTAENVHSWFTLFHLIESNVESSVQLLQQQSVDKRRTHSACDGDFCRNIVVVHLSSAVSSGQSPIIACVSRFLKHFVMSRQIDSKSTIMCLKIQDTWFSTITVANVNIYWFFHGHISKKCCT